MRSSSSLPELREDSALSNAGTWLLLAAIALVPLFWLPWFQTGFAVPRRTLVLVVIGPLATLLISRNRALAGLARVPVLLLLAVMAAGILPHLPSFDVHEVWRSVRHLGPPIAFVLAGAALARPGSRHRLPMALVLPAIPVLAIGLLRRYADVPAILPDRPDVWIASTVGNSNELGEASAAVFLAGLALSGGMPARWQRALMAGGTACALALVVLSHSRGAWLATAAGLAVHAGLWWWPRRHDRHANLRALVVVLVAATALGVTLALPAGRGLRDLLSSFVSTTHPTNVVRLEIWGATAEVIRETLPFGAGLGRFEEAFLPHRRAIEWSLSGADTRVDNPHQELLWIASEAGVPGVLAFVLLVAVAFRRATTAGGPPAPAGRRPQRALLLVTIALVVLAFFRSPLHHASGVLPFAALLGSVAPAVPALRGSRFDLLAVPFIGAFAVLAALDASEDLRLGRAIDSLNAGKAAGDEGRREAVAPLLNDAGRRLRGVPSAILKDFDRSFRAALAAGELADLKDGLRAAAPGETFPDLPDQTEVLELLDETLRMCPHHPGATTQLALLWLKQGSVKRAEDILQDGVRALPGAPMLRHNLASLYAEGEQFGDAYFWLSEELALFPAADDVEKLRLASLSVALGREPTSFGRYLGAAAAESPARVAEGAPLPDRRKALLLHLLQKPDDGQALADLAEIDWRLSQEGARNPALAAEANRAYARSRVRFALAELARNDPGQAETFLRLGLQKDPLLIDLHFVRAKAAARSGADALALESLRAVLDRGVRRETLKAALVDDPDLGPVLSD
jgi:O-antigen ligase